MSLIACRTEGSAGGASGHPAGAVVRYLATKRCNICGTHTGTTIYICAIQYKPLAELIGRVSDVRATVLRGLPADYGRFGEGAFLRDVVSIQHLDFVVESAPF
jgi:hypothetical protein